MTGAIKSICRFVMHFADVDDDDDDDDGVVVVDLVVVVLISLFLRPTHSRNTRHPIFVSACVSVCVMHVLLSLSTLSLAKALVGYSIWAMVVTVDSVSNITAGLSSRSLSTWGFFW